MASKDSANAVLPWQTETWLGLVRQIQTRRLPHALLISGPPSLGKGHLAEILGGYMLCEQAVDSRACGRCKGCALFAAGTHPDLIQIAPGASRSTISVEQIRELSAALALSAHQGGWQVAVLEPAEGLTGAAANALLKTLEEPAPDTLLILIHHQRGPILPTLRSRCQVLSQKLPSPGAALPWLAEALGSGGPDAVELLEMAGGRPLQALALGDGEAIEAQRNSELELEAIIDGGLAPLAAAAKRSSEPLASSVESLLAFCTRRLIAAGRDGHAVSVAQLRYYDMLLQTRAALQARVNLNPQLALEDLFMGLRQFQVRD